MYSHSIGTSLRQTARRIFSYAAYHFWVKQRSARTVETRLLGFRMVVPPTVFHPRYFFTSKFIAKFLQRQDFAGKRLLDLGCGSGILSLVMASRGGKVTSIDINPLAIEATRKNAQLNGLSEHISPSTNDVSGGLDLGEASFDFIVTNPPYYQSDPSSLAERAFKGGARNEFIAHLAFALRSLLRPEGSLLIVLSSDVNTDLFFSPFPEQSFSIRPLETKRLLFETLTIYQISQKPAKGKDTSAVD